LTAAISRYARWMRLAELMDIFSVAADTGMGMPQDHG
jgi:hypothetical protein